MASLLPLHDDFATLGATFREVDGWVLPLRFSDPIAEVGTARGAAGFIDLSASGKIRMAGADRIRFLQRILTNDIKKTVPGTGCYAALLDHKGHVLSDMRVLVLPEEVIILTPPNTIDTVRDTLNRFVVTDDVESHDVTQDCVLFSLQGPHAADMWDRLAGEPAPPFEEYGHRVLQVEDELLHLIQSDHTGDQGFDILTASESASKLFHLLLEKGRDLGVSPIGFEAANVLRVEAGIPWYGVDMDSSNLIQEALLEEAVSYTKGCFVGQETVARLHSRGHVNKQLCGFRISGNLPPASGDKVYVDSAEAGWITSGVYSPSLRQAIALGYMRREVTETGTPVSVKTGDSTLSAEIAQLPLYPPAAS